MIKNLWLSGVILSLCSAAAFAGSPVLLDDSSSGTTQLIDSALTVPSPAAAPEYWLGIGCSPLPPQLRAQLNLPEKQGLLVQAVVPNSPAAKAGIAQHDVLLRAGDKVLDEPRDLLQAVEAAKETKLKIELLHGGKPSTVEATPTKRPPEAQRRAMGIPLPGDRETMEKWLQGMLPEGNGSRSPKSFRFIHPGAIVPHDVLAPVPLPPNLSISISKTGDQPAKIVVQRGEEKWEVTEKELDKLPADIRPHVERMLGHGPLGIVGDFVPKLDPSVDTPEGGAERWEMPFSGQEGFPQLDAKLFERMEKRFDAMERRMDNLRKQIEGLDKDHESKNPVEK